MSNTIDKPAEKRVFVIYGGHNGLQPIFYSYSKTIKNCLPANEQRALSAAASTWGDEIYFAIPMKTGLENAVSVVREGDLAYWPEGSCFCISFGKTPASSDIFPFIKDPHRVEIWSEEFFSAIIKGQLIIDF